MVYRIAEKFKSIQGEGVYTGTPMAFIRFVGCSVGKTICQHCDTDFDKPLPWRGGGEFSERDLLLWAYPYRHVCITGGEPLDQDLVPLFLDNEHVTTFHIETSGTVMPDSIRNLLERDRAFSVGEERRYWLCVSPKPGFREDVVALADEVKVIVPGLGEINQAVRNHWTLDPEKSDPQLKRWPVVQDAVRWAAEGKTVFLQPRNAKYDVDYVNLGLVQDILREHPELRLSTQMHKILKVQ